VDRPQFRGELARDQGLVDRVSFAGEPDLLAQPSASVLCAARSALNSSGLRSAAVMRELVRSDPVITGFLAR
jgi:hypothetical protein